jgi:hypothetical protein
VHSSNRQAISRARAIVAVVVAVVRVAVVAQKQARRHRPRSRSSRVNLANRVRLVRRNLRVRVVASRSLKEKVAVRNAAAVSASAGPVAVVAVAKAVRRPPHRKSFSRREKVPRSGG